MSFHGRNATFGFGCTPAVESNNREKSGVEFAGQLPPFWCDKPSLWFVQIEAIIASQKLNDEGKFNMVVGRLSKNVLVQVSDIVRNPPEMGEAYKAIKKRLLAVYEDSESQIFEKLLKLELCDQTPSHLLRSMRDLAQDKVSNDTIEKLWLRLLPGPVKAILAITPVTDKNALDEKAQTADKIMENLGLNVPSSTVNVVQTEETTLPMTKLTDLGKQIANLTTQFEEFKRFYREIDLSRRVDYDIRRSRSKRRSVTPGSRSPYTRKDKSSKM